EKALALVLGDVGDQVEREVQNPLEVPRGHVEQDAKTTRGALEEPDVRDGGRELDVAHSLATHLRARHLDAALVADDALVPDALVLAAVALPVPRGTEDALVEEPVLFRTERAVVDRLGLRDLAARPGPDLVRRRERDADRVELVYLNPSLFNTLKTADVDAEVRLVQRGVLGEADSFLAVVEHLDGKAQRLEFLDEHLERFRDSRRLDVLALTGRLVRPAA